MKKGIVLALMVLFSLTIQAQKGNTQNREARKEMREKMQDLSPQQIAELTTKKMALHLDLTEAQQKKIYPIEVQIATLKATARENKVEGKDLSKEEHFESKKAILDKKIEIKAQYKSILKPEQFEKWEKMHQRRGKVRKMAALKKRG